MELHAFDSFDPTPYQRVPLVNLASMVALARALADGLPDPSGPLADGLDWQRPRQRAAKMLAIVAVVEDEQTRRRQAADGSPRYGTRTGSTGPTTRCGCCCATASPSSRPTSTRASIR